MNPTDRQPCPRHDDTTRWHDHATPRHDHPAPGHDHATPGHDHPAPGHDHPTPGHGAPGLNRIAFLATLHCLTGCAVGEVLGMVVGTALGLSNGATIGLAVALAFLSGYAFTMGPLLRTGMRLREAARLALAADSVSILIMEVVDNLIMLAVPGAMDASLVSPLFWGSLAAALAIAGLAAFPVNRWLIARGRGHAVAHAAHRHEAGGRPVESALHALDECEAC